MDTDIYNKISKSQSDLNYHRLEIKNLLVAEFPEGCRVYVKYKDGQKDVGTVVSHDQDKIGVQLHAISGTTKPKNYYWKVLEKTNDYI